jgi:glycosyltransferase involved in cell wall biosynthesis
MKIVIDGRCLMVGRRTGVEEYTLNLLLALFEADKKNQYVLFFNSWKEPVFNFDIFKKYKNVEIKRHRIPNKILNFSFWYLGWPKIDKLAGETEVVFMPNINFAAISRNCKLILTIHDLSFECYPNHFSWKRRFWHIFINPKKLCRRADKIIAISDSTRSDLISLYKINPAKIETIYSAAGDGFKVISRNDTELVRVKEKYRLPYKFILYLGTIEPRKNIGAVIRAFDSFNQFAIENKNVELMKYGLVIAGEKGWLSQKIFEEIKTTRSSKGIYFIGRIRNENKKYIYNLASLFVYPSFFEGFGFPPLEAMRCGVPVIASNNSSLPEVVGDGGMLIDPDKPDEICRAMKEILSNRELRDILVKKGLEKAAKFDWKKTAQKTLEMMKKMEDA